MAQFTKRDIEMLLNTLIETIDPLVTYDEAAQMLNTTKHAVYCKVSRSGIPIVHRRKLLKYSDVMRIKRKEV